MKAGRVRFKDDSVETYIARFVADLQQTDISTAADTAFDRLLLDYLAVVVSGLRDGRCRRVADTFGGVTLAAANPSSVAFAQGVAAHWFDWDDTHDASHVHGGATIFPALLAFWDAGAVAASRRSGKEFIVAAIAAYDVACRVGGHLKENGHRGWMPTGSGGALGAAAACARLAGGDRVAIESAMGIAASNAGLSRQALADKTNGKGILAAIASRTGVDAALLERSGVRGASHFLAGVYGLSALHANHSSNPQESFAELGKPFSITEVSIKPYPCCRSAHAVIDAMLDFRARFIDCVDRVASIHVSAPRGVVERCGAAFTSGTNPRLSAQFSIPFTAALALRKGRITLRDFSPEKVLEFHGEAETLIGSVSVELARDIFGDVLVPVDVRFEIEDGRSIDIAVNTLRGDSHAPLDADEQREKLIVAGDGLLSVNDADVATNVVRDVREHGPDALIAWLKAISQVVARGSA